MNLLPHKIIKYQIYLLQLENYNLKRFAKIFCRGLKKQRQEITWTAKLKIVTLIAVIIKFILAIAGGWAIYLLTQSVAGGVISALIILYISSLLFGVYLILVTLIIWPLDCILKQRIINKAKQKIKSFPELKIIGITGSYGKTTMKETVATILSQKYKVLASAENKNTPLGISQLILDELDESTNILIIEMGAYQIGDIKDMCDITKPNIAILTGINESHLERFGSIANTILAKFEIIINSTADAKIILNIDDDLVKKNYQQQIGSKPSSAKATASKEVSFYSTNNNQKAEYKISNQNFFTDGSGISFDLDGFNNLKVPLLGEYILGTIMAGVIIAEKLGLTKNEIKTGINKIKPIEHRLQLIKGSNDILVIDDSYNGNPAGAQVAIKTLSKFKNKRKIYVTPGLVEAGDKIKELHYNIGKQLSGVADKVILIKNSVTAYIKDGLVENNFKEENIIFFDSAQEAHNSMGKITKAGDVVLFQNDWPDNYI